MLRLTIAAPEGVVFEGEVESVSLPGTLGAFTVLPMHAPLISSLAGGKIVYVRGGQPSELEVSSGFVEVRQDVVAVCVEL